MAKLKQQLSDDWREAWKWLTVRLTAILAIAPELYTQVEGMREYLPANLFHHAMAMLGLLVIVAQVRKKAA